VLSVTRPFGSRDLIRAAIKMIRLRGGGAKVVTGKSPDGGSCRERYLGSRYGEIANAVQGGYLIYRWKGQCRQILEEKSDRMHWEF